MKIISFDKTAIHYVNTTEFLVLSFKYKNRVLKKCMMKSSQKNKTPIILRIKIKYL